MRDVKFDRLPRMAEFATVALAAAPALGFKPDDVLSAYEGNRAGLVANAIEASPIGPAVVKWMAAASEWTGTATELFAVLDDRFSSEEMRRRRDWPKSPKGVACALRRISPNLRAHGIHVEFHDPRGRQKVRLIEIRTTEGNGPHGPHGHGEG